MNSTLTFDAELGKLKTTTDGVTSAWYSTEEFLHGKPLNDYPDIQVLIAESAHMAERSRWSLAQIWTAAELQVLRKTYANQKILAFPEILTPKAREEHGLGKEDSVLAIWRYHRDHPDVSLRNWNPSTPRDAELCAVLTEQRHEMNARLNYMRRMKYQDPQCQHALDVLADAAISDNLQLWTGYKIGPRGGLSWRETFVMSLYVAIFLEDGSLRLNPAGNPIGERWLWKMLMLHPYHRKAGVARSNLMFHCYRNMVKKFPDDKTAKRSFRLAVAECRKVFQDAGLYPPAAHAGILVPAPDSSGNANMTASA